MSGKKKPSEKKAVAAEAPSPPPVTEPALAKGRKPDYQWLGKPVYRCHRKEGCQYERVENLEAVLRHEEGHQPPVQESRILGADGKPLKVEGDHE